MTKWLIFSHRVACFSSGRSRGFCDGCGKKEALCLWDVLECIKILGEEYPKELPYRQDFISISWDGCTGTNLFYLSHRNSRTEFPKSDIAPSVGQKVLNFFLLPKVTKPHKVRFLRLIFNKTLSSVAPSWENLTVIYTLCSNKNLILFYFYFSAGAAVDS